MTSELACGRELLEDRLLEVPGFDLDQQVLARILAHFGGECASESCPMAVITLLVAFELITVGPVLVEGLLHLSDQRRLLRLRDANVPFESVGLGSMR